jgi:hypothetical protein
VIRAVRQSFAAGELAPELHMRSDLAAYQKGAALLYNMIVRRTGSAQKRPGTDALDVAAGFPAGGGPVRLIPFYYDASLSLVLLVAAGAVRVYQVSPDFGFDREFEWSGWTAEDVAGMRARQAGDTLFVTAPGRLPCRLVRTASTGAWSILTERVTPLPSSAVTLSASGNAAFVDPGKGYTPQTFRYAVFEDVGGLLEMRKSASYTGGCAPWPPGGRVTLSLGITGFHPESRFIFAKRWGAGYGVIGDVTQQSAADTSFTFYDDNIAPNEQIPYQSVIRSAADDAGGYAIMDIYQQRQVLCGNAAAPWTLWFSRLGDLYAWYSNRPADDADPFRATLPAVRASEIRHTVAGRRLLLFTSDGIFAVHAGGEGFSARTCQIERVSPAGAGAAPPLDTGAAVLFTAEDDRALLEMRYSFAETRTSRSTGPSWRATSPRARPWSAPPGRRGRTASSGHCWTTARCWPSRIFRNTRCSPGRATRSAWPGRRTRLKTARRPLSFWTSPRQGPCCATPASGRRGATRPPSACSWP